MTHDILYSLKLPFSVASIAALHMAFHKPRLYPSPGYITRSGYGITKWRLFISITIFRLAHEQKKFFSLLGWRTRYGAHWICTILALLLALIIRFSEIKPTISSSCPVNSFTDVSFTVVSSKENAFRAAGGFFVWVATGKKLEGWAVAPYPGP